VSTLNHRSGKWVIRESRSGGRYGYWMPAMPRIYDAFVDCAIYLYASEDDAERGEKSGGSGFLLGVPTTDLPTNGWFTYAVTNRHVVENGGSVIRLRTKSGKHFPMPIDDRAWVFHPDGDDIAICPILFDYQNMRYRCVPRESLLDREIVAKYNIGPGDDTFMVGRFINHEGTQQNLPTVRFGCIAQMPLEPVKQSGRRFDQESFLVESRSIGGYSGAPVFVYIPMFSTRENVEDWYPPVGDSKPGMAGVASSLREFASKEWGSLRAHGPWLLGVDWGHINSWQPVCDRSGRPIDRSPGPPWDHQIVMNTGIMTVVPAWKLIELVEEGPIAEHRKEGIEQLRKSQENDPPAGTMD
jgi:hypothetical protein